MSTLQNLQHSLSRQSIDVAIIQNPATIGYLTGFYSEPHERLMLLIVLPDQLPLLLLPMLDVEQAKQKTTDLNYLPYLDSDNVWLTIQRVLTPYRQLAIGIEKHYTTVYTVEQFQKYLPNITFTHDISPIIEQLKLIKTADEIERMKQAGKTADLAIQIAAQTLQEGIFESTIVAEIDYQLKKQNVSKMSFDTMVLSQKNAANPHGIPGSNRIDKNEFVLIDLGTIYKGYASDITRTLFFGNSISREQEKIYNIVLEAHHAARDAVKIGMSASELDAIARQIITKYGYGDYFTHRLGHGIGQSVHEVPSIAQGNDFILKENMCFSIEPGIYIPNNLGIRIEDCFYLTKNGAKSFTHSPYSLHYKDYI